MVPYEYKIKCTISLNPGQDPEAIKNGLKTLIKTYAALPKVEVKFRLVPDTDEQKSQYAFIDTTDAIKDLKENDFQSLRMMLYAARTHEEYMNLFK